MSWKLMTKPRTLQVNPALAKRFAEMERAPNDRPLSERRLAVYGRLLEAGQFRPVTWASAYCKETNCVYRVNGKHTSVLLSGLPKIPQFFVTIEEYTCPKLDDVARLYATFDSALQNRSARDIYASFAGTVDELRNVPINTLALAATGIAYHVLTPEKHGQSRPPERAEYLLEHHEFVAWLNDLYANGPATNLVRRSNHTRNPHLRRLGVTAAAFAAWLKNTPKATQFWEAVRDETGASLAVPDRKLSRFLLSVKTTSSHAKKGEDTATNREMYVKCLHAWNAWCAGETTNLNYYASKPVPVVLG